MVLVRDDDTCATVGPARVLTGGNHNITLSPAFDPQGGKVYRDPVPYVVGEEYYRVLVQYVTFNTVTIRTSGITEFSMSLSVVSILGYGDP